MAEQSPLDRFFAHLYHRRPVDATFIGEHSQDHRLPDWSPAGLDAEREEWGGVEHALRGQGAQHMDASALTGRDWTRIDEALALAHTELTIAELDGRHFQRGNPSLAVGEVAFGVVSLVTRDFAPASDRARTLVQRLRQVPRFLAGAATTLAGGPVASAWRDRAVREARATGLLLDDGLPIWCDAMSLSSELRDRVTEAGQLASGAVAAFAQVLSDRPVTNTPTAGREHLQRCLSRGHWITESLDQLLVEARDAFAEAAARLRTAVVAAGAASWADIQARLAAQHPTPEEYYTSFARCLDQARIAAERACLITWPDAPLRYVPIPEWTRMAAPSLYYLYYRSPSPFDALPVHDYVVTPIEDLDPAAAQRHLQVWNDSAIKLNHVVHHGGLGHHVQNWHASRCASRIGRVAATDCASRIAMLLGGTMAEGWACYATDLMEEVGFLTPDECVAEQHTRLRLLARAIVDLEFHSGLRSFDACVQFYMNDVGMAPAAAEGEVVKTSMFPGTAAMYWLGTRAIHGLRRELEVRGGARFSLRAFHDDFLSHGSIPVALTARLMLARDA